MVLMCACMDPVAPGKQLHQALPEPEDACLVCQAVRNGTASIQHRSYIDVLLHVVRSISRVRTLVCSLHPLWRGVAPRCRFSARRVLFCWSSIMGKPLSCLLPDSLPGGTFFTSSSHSQTCIHTANTLVKCSRCSGRSVAAGGAGGVQACGASRRSRWYSILDAPHRSSLFQHPFLCTHHLRGHGCAMVGARFLQQHGPR